MYGYAMNCGCGTACGPKMGRRGRNWQKVAWPVQVWAAQQLAAQQALASRSAQGSGAWTPGIDVREDAAAYYLSADLPGLAREDIQLELEEDQLTLSAERQPAQSAEGEEVRWQGRRYGSFSRSFRLPRTVDADAISAEYKDGVLQVTLPKVPVVSQRVSIQ